jgi:1,4-alpha-glucan branching enzyme
LLRCPQTDLRAVIKHSLRQPLAACIGSCLFFALPLAGQAEDATQAPPPKKVDGGIQFTIHAPKAEKVYLAGSFNNWANNEEGVITEALFAMEGPDEKGLWTKVIPLDPGEHQLKICLNGKSDGWRAPYWARQLDEEGNAIITVTPGGDPLVQSDRNDKWKPRIADGKVTFYVYRPQAKAVYLATDFNNWANNNNGIVTEEQFAMEGPDKDGVWTKTVVAGSGRIAYQFVINGNSWEADPNVLKRDAENHSVLVVE